MKQFSKLNIENYRGIKDLVIPSLNTINLIVGDNNCGKTSVLEAIQFLKTPNSYTNCIRISRQRELIASNRNSVYENFINMFPKSNEDLKISVSGKYADKDIIYKLQGKTNRVLVDSNDDFVAESFYNEETEAFKGIAQYQFGTIIKKEKIEITNYTKI